MKKITETRLLQLLEQCKGKRIAVVGDVMLDRYIWGRVARISPEAPVPVVEVQQESVRLGGAANVANNIANLGAIPLLFGVIGNDFDGKALKALLMEKGFSNAGIIQDSGRPTTVKTRIIAHNQHIVRADRELTNDIPDTIAKKLLKLLEKNIQSIHGIIIQDYNKGVITKSVIPSIIQFARRNDCPITVDPKFNNFFEYKKVTVFKPNIVETQNALGIRLDSNEQIREAGKILLKRLECDYVLMTRGAEGMSLFSGDGSERTVPAKAREIHDVSGAGDTVIGVLTAMLTAGADIVEAATIANYSAGVVCGEVGIVPIELQKLITAIKNDYK